MSIIDKKGKLFGKLNIIDLIAVILIVAVVALLGYKLMSNQDGGLAGEGQPVVYTVKVKNVDQQVYDFIQDEVDKGPCQLTANNELLDAYVTKVEATSAEDTTFTVQKNRNQGFNPITLVEAGAGTYDLVFTIEGTVKDNLTSALGSQEIRVGKTHIVKTTTFELENGVILSCDRLETEEAQ